MSKNIDIDSPDIQLDVGQMFDIDVTFFVRKFVAVIHMFIILMNNSILYYESAGEQQT